MARTAAFRSFVRLMTAALLADRRRCSVVDAVGMLREQTQNTPAISRRRFLFVLARVMRVDRLQGIAHSVHKRRAESVTDSLLHRPLPKT